MRLPSSANCTVTSPQPLLARLERHDVSTPSPSCMTGAHVGTVSATYWPFLIGSVDDQRELDGLAEVAVERSCIGPFATTVRLSFLPESSTTMAACAAPP